MEIKSDIVPDEYKKRAEKLAIEHVDFLLNIMRPLMLAEFNHGYRHGFEEKTIEHKEELLQLRVEKEILERNRNR